jgi:uncharacterized membrane protein YkvA (DUF1232 family)
MTLEDQQPSGKLRAFFARFRHRAEKVIDDAAAVEATLEAVHRRVARHRSLQVGIEPLERLVRSYIRRSYAPADKGDVLLALAALIYVQSPIDAIPDFAPGGLKDDEAVVRRVSQRIAETLAAYADWEETLGEDFEELDELGEFTLGDLPATLNVQLLDAPDSALFARADTSADRHAPAVAAGPIATTLADAGIAIHQGQVLQVLGPPHLVQGLRDGTYHLLETSTGHIGTVADQSGIVGHLRVGTDLTQAAAQGALAAFKVASVVTLQYYLARIDTQLVAIDRQLKAIQQDLLDETFGEIQTARESCADVEEVLRDLGHIGALDLQRLAHAEQRIDHAYHAQVKKLEGFCSQVDALLAGDQLDRDRCADLLREGSGRRLAQAQLMLYAAVVRHRLNGLAVAAAAQESPDRARLASAKLNREHAEMLRGLRKVARAFRRMHLRKRVFDATWPLRGGPERELQAFSAETRGIREQLASPLEVLPALEPAQPFLFEVIRDADGVLRQRQAMLVPA